MEISTPGRVCLFGEHQDYLGLPVLAMAISLRSAIRGTYRNDSMVIIHKPDIGKIEKFSFNNLEYESPRDHFKSGLKVCKKFGFKFSKGFGIKVALNPCFSAKDLTIYLKKTWRSAVTKQSS